jgi:WD40 repeat protein
VVSQTEPIVSPVLGNAILTLAVIGIIVMATLPNFHPSVPNQQILAAEDLHLQPESVKSLTLVSADDHQVEIWRAYKDKLEKSGAPSTTTSLETNPDGKKIVTTSLPWVSPDGKSLALVSDNNWVQIWKASQDKLGKRLQFKAQGPVGTLEFSPDSKSLALVSDHDWVQIWNASKDSSKKLIEFKAPSPVAELKFSPDGKRVITTGEEGAKWLFDVETGKTLENHPDRLPSF